MVFTTNKEITQREELMVDQALVMAILNRLVHGPVRIDLGDVNMQKPLGDRK